MASTTEASSADSEDPPTDGKTRSRIIKCAVFVAVAAIILVAYLKLGDSLSLESLASQETELREYQQRHPVLTFGIAFVVYVVMTGLSLPGAAALTLVYGWYFRLTQGVILVSFASTMGATLAFLLSRYFLGNAIQNRFGDRLKSFNENLEREGAFYLFTLRLIPAVPFFVINVVMGLTPMKTRTFWWVSQLGMLAGTVTFVYAGSTVPDLQTLADQGASSILTGKLIVGFVLLGVFPLVAKQIINLLRKKESQPQ